MIDISSHSECKIHPPYLVQDVFIHNRKYEKLNEKKHAMLTCTWDYYYLGLHSTFLGYSEAATKHSPEHDPS
jgi:hypothetical protein